MKARILMFEEKYDDALAILAPLGEQLIHHKVHMLLRPSQLIEQSP